MFPLFSSLQDVMEYWRAIPASLHTETKHKPQAHLSHRADGPLQRGTIIPVMIFFSPRHLRSAP
jgi:hypothetical protein